MLKTLFAVKGMSKNYFKREQFILKIGGISLTSNESIAYKIYSFFIRYFLIFPYPIVAYGDLFKHELAVFPEIAAYFVGTYMSVIIIAVTSFNRLKLGKLLKNLEQEPFVANVERGGDKEEELINIWISFKEKQNLLLGVVIVMVYTGPVIFTFIKRLTSNDYHDWNFGFGAITIINVTYSPNYEILWMYQNMAAFYIAISMCTTILILAAILAFISVQFKMLQNNLRRMVPNSYRNMLKDTSGYTYSTITEIDASTIPWKYLKMSLKKAVDYHLDIIDIAEELTRIFSNTILSMYLCSLGIVCFEVYRASLLPIGDAGALMMYFQTAFASLLPLFICYGGQNMTDESFNVARAAYEANYVGVDIRFRKGLLMIIKRSYKPLSIKAGKFIETSMVTYVWILRSAYSACMVLRRVHDK